MGKVRRVLAVLAVLVGPVLAGCATGAAGATGATAPPAPVTVTVPASNPATSTPVSAPTSAAASEPNGGGLVPPNCPTSSLAIGLAPGEGAADSVYRPLVFTNTGSSACQLRGYPGVSNVAGDDGHQVGPAAVEVGSRTGEVDLDPGESAHALLRAGNTGSYLEDRCRPTEVRGYRVYPPGDTAAAYVPSPGIGCAGDVTILEVHAVTPGAG